jgi:pyridoxamine 5'-phosphate oxidase
MDPIIKFQQWYKEELQSSTASIPSACCLSTIGTDGYPNARFVSLKEIKNDSFIITGPLLSRKGIEISAIPKVALTFWWEATQRQIRIQGDASIINETEADKYFQERNRESQIVSYASMQGKTINDISLLSQNYHDVEQQFHGSTIPRPDNWSGFSIMPLRIEFLEFKPTRFHERTLFERTSAGWKEELLQP